MHFEHVFNAYIVSTKLVATHIADHDLANNVMSVYTMYIRTYFMNLACMYIATYIAMH